MKKFIKKSLILGLLAGTMAVVAGCGTSATPNKPVPQPQQSSMTPTAPAPTTASASVTTPTTGTSASGKDIFDKNCGSCHGTGGIGGTAPALNKATLSSVAASPITKDSANVLDFVKKGKIEKGMPAWQGVLSDADLKTLSDYVASLK